MHGRGYLQDNTDQLFKGKAIDYRDCLHVKGEYPSQVRCKLNIAGTKSCSFLGHKQSAHRRTRGPARAR